MWVCTVCAQVVTTAELNNFFSFRDLQLIATESSRPNLRKGQKSDLMKLSVSTSDSRFHSPLRTNLNSTLSKNSVDTSNPSGG